MLDICVAQGHGGEFTAELCLPRVRPGELLAMQIMNPLLFVFEGLRPIAGQPTFFLFTVGTLNFLCPLCKATLAPLINYRVKLAPCRQYQSFRIVSTQRTAANRYAPLF